MIGCCVTRRVRGKAALLVLVAIQGLAAAFFIGDVAVDILAPDAADPDDRDTVHGWFEAMATLGLLGAIAVELRLFPGMVRRQADRERQVSHTAMAFQEVLDDHFMRWALAPSETDVANSMVKGATIAEIARMRGAAEATVKSHLNAIHRKAGVGGRGERQGLIIDDLFAAPASAPGPSGPAHRGLSVAVASGH